jgi:hypothetical protein
VTWSRLLLLNGSTVTYTLNDQWNNTGTVSFGGSGTFTINGATLGIGGDLSVTTANTIQGTSPFLLNGTGTWSHSAAGYIQNNIRVDTAGDIKMGNSYFRSNIFSYVTGPFSPQTNTTLFTSGTTTFSNVGSIYWQSISLSGTTTITSTNSNFNIIGTFSNASQGPAFSLGTYSLLFRDSLGSVRGSINLTSAVIFTLPNAFDVFNATLGNSTLTTTINSHTMSIWGSLIVNPTTGIVTGNSNIQLVGTNSYIFGGSTGILRNNLTINSEGTIIGTFYYNTGTIRYISGTISYVPSNSTLNLSGSATLNTGATSVNNPNGMEWNNVTMTGTSQTFTHQSITRISGTLSLSGTTGLINNGSEINVKNLSVTTTAANTGTTKINFAYSGGRWNHTTTGTLANPVEIDESITFGTNIYYRTGTFSTISESVGNSVITSGSTFNVSANTVFSTAGLRFNNILVSGTTTITLGADLITNGTMSLFAQPSSVISFTLNGNNLLFTNSSNVVVGTFNLGTNGFGGTTAQANTFTFTLPQSINVYDFYFGSSSGTNTCNANSIYVHRTLRGALASINTGTTLIVMTGSTFGNFSPLNTGGMRNNVNFAKTGTISFSDPIYYDAGELSYTSGTISIGHGKSINTTLGFTWSLPYEANSSGLIVGQINLSGASAKTIRLNSDLHVSDRIDLQAGSLSFTGSSNLLFFGVDGGNNPSQDLTGSLWLRGSTTFVIPHNLILKDLYTTYAASSTNTTISGISPNNQITVMGDLLNDGSSGITLGTGKVILGGTGSWKCTQAGVNQMRVDVTIDTLGTITFGTYSTSGGILITGTSPYFGNATFSYIKGNVVSTNAGLNIIENSTFDTGTMSLNKYSVRPYLGTTPNINLKSKLLANEIRVTTNCGFYGDHGFEVNKLDLSFSSTNNRILLQQSKTYIVNQELKSYTNFTEYAENTFSNSNYIRSWSHPTLSSPTMSYLILAPTATHSVLFLSAQNIDSSGGKTIRTFGATLSNTTNWRSVSSDIPSTGWAIIS